jgi:hypothetical protein
VYGPGGQGVYQDPTYGPVSVWLFHLPLRSVTASKRTSLSCKGPNPRICTVTQSLCYSCSPLLANTSPPGTLLPLYRHTRRIVCRWRQEIRLEQARLLEWLAGGLILDPCQRNLVLGGG